MRYGRRRRYVTEEREAKRRDLKREAEVRPPLVAPAFEHFDWWSPLLRSGVHYVHVSVRKRAPKEELCRAIAHALDELDRYTTYSLTTCLLTYLLTYLLTCLLAYLLTYLLT